MKSASLSPGIRFVVTVSSPEEHGHFVVSVFPGVPWSTEVL
jgi:hypothetical protein